jgi:cobalt-zinc-cadmium efflux system protein
VSAGHTHAPGLATAAGRHRGRLVAVLAVSSVILVVEVIGAVLTGSLALLADAGHLLTDVAGIGIALFAVTLAARPATPDRTFGYARAEILAAVVNAVLLFAVAAFVIIEAIRRMDDPPEVAGGAMLVFGLAGLAGNLVSMWLLARGQAESLNLRGAFLEVAADAVSSIGVLAAAVIIALTGFARADAIVSLAIGLFILPRTWRLLREAVDVLMEASPKGVDLRAVRAHILDIAHIRDVHDLHASTVTSGLPVLTAHVVVDDSCFLDGHAPQLLDALQACLAGHFDVEHSTFQLEPAGHADHEHRVHT